MTDHMPSVTAAEIGILTAPRAAAAGASFDVMDGNSLAARK